MGEAKRSSRSSGRRLFFSLCVQGEMEGGERDAKEELGTAGTHASLVSWLYSPFPSSLPKQRTQAHTLFLSIAKSPLYACLHCQFSDDLLLSPSIRRIFTVFVDLRQKETRPSMEMFDGRQQSVTCNKRGFYELSLPYLCILFTTVGVILRNNILFHTIVMFAWLINHD